MKRGPGLPRPDMSLLFVSIFLFAVSHAAQTISKSQARALKISSTDVPTQFWDVQVDEKFSHFHLFLLESLGHISEDALMNAVVSDTNGGVFEDKDHLLVRGFVGLKSAKEAFPECDAFVTAMMPLFKQTYLELANPGIMEKLKANDPTRFKWHLRRVNSGGIALNSKKNVQFFKNFSTSDDRIVEFLRWLAECLNIDVQSCPISADPLRMSLPFAPLSAIDIPVLRSIYKVTSQKSVHARLIQHYNRVDSIDQFMETFRRIYSTMSYFDVLAFYHFMNPDKPVTVDSFYARYELARSLRTEDVILNDRLLALEPLWDHLRQFSLAMAFVQGVSNQVSQDGLGKEFENEINDLRLACSNIQGPFQWVDSIARGNAVPPVDKLTNIEYKFKSLKEKVDAWNAKVFEVVKLEAFEKCLRDIQVNLTGKVDTEKLARDLAALNTNSLYRHFGQEHLSIFNAVFLIRKELFIPSVQVLHTVLHEAGIIDLTYLRTSFGKVKPLSKYSVFAFGDSLISLLPEAQRKTLIENGGQSHQASEYILHSLSRMTPNDIIEEAELNELFRLLSIYYAASGPSSSDDSNEALIESMKIGTRLFLPVRVNGHGLAVEVIREAEDVYEVTFINSGEGIGYHDQVVGKNRWIYYQKFKMTRQQIQDSRYFLTVSIIGPQIKSHFMRGTKIDVSSMLPVDSVSSQKSVTCSVKAVMYLIKWFLSRPKGKLEKREDADARYAWFKTWLFADLFDSLAQNDLLNANLTFDSYHRLQSSWNVPSECIQTCKFQATQGLRKPFLRHAILRRLGLARKHGQSQLSISMEIRGMLLKLLLKLIDDTELVECFLCIDGVQ